MIALDAEMSLRVENAAVLEIECVSGVLWITREGDICDRFLGPGESFDISGRGVTLATPLERSLVRVIERFPAPCRLGWRSWFHRPAVVRRSLAVPRLA
jgi:hypothetical protein